MRNLAPFFLVLLLSPVTKGGFISDWQASSGLYPDQIPNPYTLFDSSTSGPVLSGGVLQIATATAPQILSYSQSGSILDTSAPFYIEARVRRVSGSTSNAAREPISILFATGAGTGNLLFIGDDEVFVNTSNLVSGPRAAVDTDNAFHTYRIDYAGNGNFTVSQDGIQVLTGSTFNSPSDFGNEMTISWGDGTSLATGTSEWVYFQHNALTVSAVPEPTQLGIACLASTLIWSARGRFRRPSSK